MKYVLLMLVILSATFANAESKNVLTFDYYDGQYGGSYNFLNDDNSKIGFGVSVSRGVINEYNVGNYYVNLTYPVVENLYIVPKIGVYGESITIDGENYYDSDLTYGVGVLYSHNHLVLGVGVTDISYMINVGFSY